MLLHGFGADNLRSLYVYSLHKIYERGGDLSRLEPIALYAERHWNYQESIKQLNDELGVEAPVEFGPLDVSEHFAYPVFPTIDVF